MFDFLTGIGIVAGAILGMGVIWRKGLLPLYQLLKHVEEVHEIIMEFPDWKRTVDTSLLQLSPNSGHSLHDMVTETNTVVAETKEELDSLRALVQEHIDSPTAHS